jgi:hypothetical protein
MRTVPVKYSAGPFPDGREPALLMSMALSPIRVEGQLVFTQMAIRTGADDA